MTVDAFGREAMTLEELRDQLNTMIEMGEGGKPVWVDSGDLFKPVRNVRVSGGNFVLAVRHV